MILAHLVAAAALSYLLGSVPFGLLLTRAAGLGDVRRIGSGNIGATNVMRTGHTGLGALTLLLDAAKGFAAVWIVRHLYVQDLGAVAGLFAVLGHVFPVWLRFQGGKGVATALGVFFALHWLLGLFVAGMWLAVFALMRISSLASMIAIGYSGIAAFLISGDVTALLCLGLATLIIFTHRGNIKRLLQGTEHHFKESAP